MSLTDGFEITVSAPAGQSWQVISRDPVADQSLVDLSLEELSAEDLGCEPGTTYKIALVDDEDREIRSVLVAAR